jgi:hypothetical protein
LATVDPQYAEPLRSERLLASAEDAGTVALWGSRAIETQVGSPLRYEAAALEGKPE